MDHDAYLNTYIREVLDSTKTVAMVGASPKWNRPSYFVMKYLQAKGYRVIPVNPGAIGQEILGETVYGDLKSIPEPVDMVDIFRRSEAVPEIAEDAMRLFPTLRTIWMQFGVQHPQTAVIAEARGFDVVQNRCPKIEYQRLFGELRRGGFNTGIISSKLVL